jgi:Telomere resolvase
MVRKWLQQAIESDYIPAIKALKNTPKGRQQAESLNSRIRQQWYDRGSKTLLQQQGLMDDTRKTLKNELGEDHWILNHIKFTTEEHTEINAIKQKRVGDRNEAIQQIDHPDKIVAEAVRLLKSPNWANIAAGLAVLTGRRVAEILSTAKFKKRSQFSILFTGALKRRGEPVELSFEIPTLTSADHVITALSRLRAELPEAVLMPPRDINKKYESAVATVCDRSFANLVPAREGQGNLYTHLFRAVYATIASFWYCPPSVNETEFKAAIQGHYSIREAQDDHLQRSLAASRHYSDYEISDQEVARYHGKRKGIKLGLAGVAPIEQFRQALAPKPQKQRREEASYRMWKEDKQRLQHHLEQFEGTQQERFHALLNHLEALQNQSVQSKSSTTALDNIPMQPHLLDSQPELDDIEIATPQDSKIDHLLQAISQLVEVQTALIPTLAQAQSSSTRAAKPLTALDTDHEQPEVAPRQRADIAETRDRINQAINSIIQYNNQPGRKHQEKWAIGISSLKSFVKNQEAIVAVVGGKNRKGELVTGTRQQDIQLHHHHHQIEPDKHNYVHRGKTKISDVVPLPK